jgi:hypothetical protein
MLAPISWCVPPRHYGPWEQVVPLLTEGLVRRGADVTLFATADSVTDARLVASAPTGYSEDPGLSAKVWEALHISAVFERARSSMRSTGSTWSPTSSSWSRPLRSHVSTLGYRMRVR